MLGVVAYTGVDTKVIKNADKPKPKQSRLERLSNILILTIIGVQLLMCAGTFAGAWIWNSRYAESYREFVPVRTTALLEGLLTFATTWILVSSLVPISLIISLEIVKLIQAFYINSDEDMYDVETKRHARVFSSVLNEELGQIEYIFSDKTGTLTCNVMELRHCVIAESVFGAEGSREPAAKPRPLEDETLARLLCGKESGSQTVVELSGGNSTLRLKSTAEVAKLFVLTLATCHGCVVDASDGFTYLGPSPDEIALVDSARALGFAFLCATNNSRKLEIAGNPLELLVLHFFAFSSARKRASIVLRHEGRVLLLTKGADAIILERLAQGVQPFLPKVERELQRFSLVGLRTLCIAARVLSEEDWRTIEDRFSAFRGANDEATLVEGLIDEHLERGLTLLGCTAVEDRLQEGVPQTVADFLAARIHVWMLTGDKLETAENIAYSCRLLQPHFRKLYLKREEELSSRAEELTEALTRRTAGERLALLLEGHALLNLTENPILAEHYAREIFARADAVVCCRMSPKQKGDIVRLMKKFCTGRTLAIGDGANDANMIQEAHVGIGLYGREGMRAIQAADYGLPDFQSLWKLLFVHGRWSYMRIADMILYFYYKSVVFNLPKLYFIPYSAWSGQSLYDDFYIVFYNLVFTSGPVVVRAVTNADIYYREWRQAIPNTSSHQKLLKRLSFVKQHYPHLYYVGQLNTIFNFRNLFYWITAGIVSSVAIFWFVAYALQSNVINAGGCVYDLWVFSIAIYTCVLLTVTIKICVFNQRFTWLFVFSVLVLSLFLYAIYIFIADLIPGFRVYRTARALLSTPNFYLCILLLALFSLIIDLMYVFYKKEVRTPLAQMFRSLEEESHDIPKQRAYQLIITTIKSSLFDTHPVFRRWRSKDHRKTSIDFGYESLTERSQQTTKSNPLMVTQKKLTSKSSTVCQYAPLTSFQDLSAAQIFVPDSAREEPLSKIKFTWHSLGK